MNPSILKGNLVDCLARTMSPAELHFHNGKITAVVPIDGNSPDPHLPFILPGFVDAHVHIESSMLVPAAFARLAVVHGTVATVSDPHEIANVCGIEGVHFMIDNGKKVPFKFNFGAPSCVPATAFETAGAGLNAEDVRHLLASDDIRYLSEMMNFPGAIQGEAEVMKKIEAAHALQKPVDGHAPGLRGLPLQTYVDRGISTDHECFTIEEAREKLSLGMKILIREGSAAKNFEALIPLVDTHPDMVMFCSDDKHPDSLVEGHINQLCARAVAKGCDVFHVLRAACVNPVLHYNLDVGLLRVGDPADFVVLDNLSSFRVLSTYIAGQQVAANGVSLIGYVPDRVEPINHFNAEEIGAAQLSIKASAPYPYPVMACLDGQLITQKTKHQPFQQDGTWISSTKTDVLKIIVVNRYAKAPVAKAFVHGFGLQRGAIASSVAHDSHNIVAVGVDDESLARAVNLIVKSRGGVSCVDDSLEHILPLPVAGLMSADDGYAVASSYTEIDRAAKLLGSPLSAPFMTLSFMALLVIPHLKLGDKGLFDGDSFSLYP